MQKPQSTRYRNFESWLPPTLRRSSCPDYNFDNAELSMYGLNSIFKFKKENRTYIVIIDYDGLVQFACSYYVYSYNGHRTAINMHIARCNERFVNAAINLILKHCNCILFQSALIEYDDSECECVLYRFKNLILSKAHLKHSVYVVDYGSQVMTKQFDPCFEVNADYCVGDIKGTNFNIGVQDG